MNNFFKKRWDILILILIIVTSFFIRFYKFNDFLLFRADQSRDVRIVKTAFDNGSEYLRILGPKIARVELENDKGRGDTANLGPYYYYTQYFFAKIFNRIDPFVLALPDFIFSLLSIGIFYFLLREFFPKVISLSTISIFAFSFVLLQYSRFAWNPNQIVFWSALFLLSIYKTVIEKEKKKRIIWFLLSFLSVLVLSQLHTMALFGFPLIMIIFWIVNRPQINWKYWLIALGMVLLFYSPVLISDYANQGDNAKRFIALFNQEGSEYTLAENLIEAGKNYGMFYSLAITTFNKHNFAWIEIVSLIFIIASLILIFFNFYKNKKKDKNNKYNNKNKQIYLILIIVYFFVFLAIYIKTSERIYRPRYWMSTACLPYIFIALWFYLIEKKVRVKKISRIIIFSITAIMMGINFYAIFWFYSSLQAGEKIDMPFREKTQIRPYREMISLNQMKSAVDIMAKEAINKENQLCFSFDEAQFKRGVGLLLEKYYPQIKFINTDNIEIIDKYNCAIFAIKDYDDTEEDLEENFIDNFEISKTYTIKPLKIWQFNNKIDNKTKKEKMPNNKNDDLEDKIEEEKVYYWAEIFNKK